MKPAVLLLSEETLKERTVVSPNLDSKFLEQTIWTVQEQHIHFALGTALYKRLLDGIVAGDLKDEEKELLDDYITNVMVFFVLSELPTVLGFKFFNKNVLKQTSEHAETASMSELAILITHYKNKAEFFLERMKKFILRNVTENKLTEYINPDAKIDTILPRKRTYSCSFVLDDDAEPGIDLGYGEGIKRIR